MHVRTYVCMHVDKEIEGESTYTFYIPRHHSCFDNSGFHIRCDRWLERAE